MKPRAVTLGSVIVIGLGVAIWDVFLLVDDAPDNTISGVVGDHPWALAILGYVCGHLVSRRTRPAHKAESAVAGVGAVGVAAATGDPLWGFLGAFVAGMAFWPNRRVREE